MGYFLVRAGLVILALSLCVLLLAVVGVVEHEALGDIARYGIATGVGAFLLGLVLGALGKAGGVVRRSRCARCKRPVRKGAIYCPDHLQEALREARDKHHFDHGSGI